MKLYKLDGSPPARSAMMAVEALGLAVDAVDCDLLKGENTSPEYMKVHLVFLFIGSRQQTWRAAGVTTSEHYHKINRRSLRYMDLTDI